jgi:hypothetical protein
MIVAGTKSSTLAGIEEEEEARMAGQMGQVLAAATEAAPLCQLRCRWLMPGNAYFSARHHFRQKLQWIYPL